MRDLRDMKLTISGVAFSAAILMTGSPTSSALAQNAPQPDGPAEVVTLTHQFAPEIPGEVRIEMNVTYLDRRIYNPLKGEAGGYDAVRLRGYEDANASIPASSDTPLVAPTIEVWPGQTVRFKLNNRLPEDESCFDAHDINVPHCFNGTNLHGHGLWVSPAGNSDNVLVSIRPGNTFEYEYNIPSDHPAGTFWYHPHLHGSTALQVSSGMAGALIIRGNRLPGEHHNGDLDRLLMAPDGGGVPERILVFQQIQYACYDDGRPLYDCAEGQVGGIESYDLFGPGSWEASGRFTSVNGTVLDTFGEVETGVVERWRMVHAGVRDTINLEIRKKLGGERIETLTAAETDDWIDRNCAPEALPYHVVAHDGLTTAHARMQTEATLQPGYRMDALVVFPEPGDYCIVDGDTPHSASVNQHLPNQRLLGLVSASGNAVADWEPADFMRDWLVSAAERSMPDGVRDRVVAELMDGLKLTSFVPHATIEDDELTGTQELVFNIDVSGQSAVFQVDGRPYAPDRIDRTLLLGDVEEWTLFSDFAGHPFHIHVNPFQIVRILDPDGNDVSGEHAGDGDDRQYQGMKGVWKDTIWVKNTGESASTRYTVVVRTRYQRYIGEFVLHCHILDHEDQGMMQNIRIALPDGRGGAAIGHRAHAHH